MTNRRKAAALGGALRSMFKALEARGVPEHLGATVDQLDAQAQTQSPDPGAGPALGLAAAGATPSPGPSPSPAPSRR